MNTAVPGPGTQHRNLIFLTKNGAGPARQRYLGLLLWAGDV
jgi:hypothetical protein